MGLEAHKATHGGDQRGESTTRVWTKLVEDLCRYPGQSGRRRLCTCQNREALLDDAVLDARYQAKEFAERWNFVVCAATNRKGDQRVIKGERR